MTIKCKLNPYYCELENINTELESLITELEKGNHALTWHSNFSPHEAEAKISNLNTRIENASARLKDICHEISEQEKIVQELKSILYSGLNPFRWINSTQRKKARLLKDSKRRINVLNDKIEQKKDVMSQLVDQVDTLTCDIDRFYSSDSDALKREVTNLQERITKLEISKGAVEQKKATIDKILHPICEEIQSIIFTKSALEEDLDVAEGLIEELEVAENPYERAMVHQECESKFGNGNPNQVKKKLESKIVRAEREISKRKAKAVRIVKRHIECECNA